MTTLLIDGDVVCYQACERRDLFEINDSSGEYEKLFMFVGEQEYTDEENELYLNLCFKNFLTIIEDLKERFFTDTVKVAVAGKGNYRLDLYPAYKANRHAPGKLRNLFVPLLRIMAAEHEIATQAHGMEADDQLRIWAEELRNEGADYVICSIDKDLKMIPGMHYLMHKQLDFESTPEYAMRFYYEQLLQGDPVDNIKGIPKVGPKKAQAFLEGAETETEFQEIVVQCYYTYFKENWREELELTGKLIYLKKHMDDWFTLDSWKIPTLEDIEPKKGAYVDPMTVERALKIIDPFSVVGKKLWEEALVYLAENYEVDGQVVELARRDEVPEAEARAYREILVIVKNKQDNKPPPPPAPIPPPKLVPPPKMATTPPPKMAEPPPKMEPTPPPKMVEPPVKEAPAVIIAEKVTTIAETVTVAKLPLKATPPPMFNPSIFKRKV